MPLPVIKPLKKPPMTPLPGTSPAPVPYQRPVTTTPTPSKGDSLLTTGTLPSSDLRPAPSSPAPAPQQASTPATTPSPPPPATPTVGERVATDLGTAGDIANDIIGDNRAATISNPYQQETDDFLKLLKERLGGLNTEEMTAARDAGMLGLDQQTAQNLERYGSIAGSNGVGGGARAALMGKALNEANYNRGQLERQLVLDNIAAKDKAAQTYGGALQGATNTGIGIETYNAGAADRDTGLRMSMPFDILGVMGGYTAGDKADASSDEASDMLKKFLGGETLGGTPTTPAANGTPVTPPQQQTVSSGTSSKLSEYGTSVANELSKGGGANWDLVNEKIQEAAQAIAADIAAANGGKLNQGLLNTRLSEWLWNSGLTSSASNGNAQRGPAAGKVPTLNELVQPLWAEYEQGGQ